ELYFDPGYDHNILVNAFTLGIAPADRLFRARAAGAGNPVIYVGARTGRDGIHGASLLASAALDATSEEKRPAVQVGDPFTEKLLLEACLELMQTDDIVAIQDMGAAGLTSSALEMAGRGGMGMVLELDRVPLREEGMTPYEILLSESQERMLLVAKAGREAAVQGVFARWDLEAAVVGRLTDDGVFRARWGGAAVVRIEGTRRALALTVDCNSRYCRLDPYLGAVLAVVEAARNLVAVGARPLAVSDCLNYGNPEKPDVMWEFQQGVQGIRDACVALETPVVSGNVSFYNETEGRNIPPTPTIAMVGLLADVEAHLAPWWRAEGDVIALLGRTREELGGSEYLAVVHGLVRGAPPWIDLEAEKRLSRVCLAAAEDP